MTTLQILRLHSKETKGEIDTLKKEIKEKYPELDKFINPPELYRLIRLYEKKDEQDKLIKRESVKCSRDKAKNREHQARFRKRKNNKAVKFHFFDFKSKKSGYQSQAK